MQMSDLNKSTSSVRSVGFFAAVVIAVAFFGLSACGVPSQPGVTSSEPPQLLRDAVRNGSPDFERLASGVQISPARLNTIERRAHNDRALEIRSTVTNNTGQIVNGLEMSAALVDENGNELRKTVITPIARDVSARPAGELQTSLRPGDSTDVYFMIDKLDRDFTDKNVRLLVTGIRVD